jgi:hypothetical protein
MRLYKKFGPYRVVVNMNGAVQQKVTQVEIVRIRRGVEYSVDYKLGYIMGSKSWLVSSCISGAFDDSLFLVEALQEALDIFTDDEFTRQELRLLGYTDHAI